MSEKYSKAELKRIAEYLIEDLRECEDETTISTWRLAKEEGYEMDDFREEDLLQLHVALFKAAKANHIILDLSVHEGINEGLPYLDFTVHNQKAQIKCPFCGSTNTARYIYGYPVFNERMQKKLDEGKWALGGCRTLSVEINGIVYDAMPKRKCNECKKGFASDPILMGPKEELCRDYREIVKGIVFDLGGYFMGHTMIAIRKNEKGALVQVEKTHPSRNLPKDRQITSRKWKEILNRLYVQMYLHEWNKHYVDLNVLDGTQWSLDIELQGDEICHYGGSNDYPPYWGELLDIFKNYAKL